MEKKTKMILAPSLLQKSRSSKIKHNTFPHNDGYVKEKGKSFLLCEAKTILAIQLQNVKFQLEDLSM